MPFTVIGSIRQMLPNGEVHTYTEGLLPEDHAIPPGRVQSFVKAGLLEEVEVIRKKVVAAPASPARKGRWDLDPDGLRGLGPVKLTLLAIERVEPGETVPKFQTEEEGVAFLSRDFNPVAPKAEKRKVIVEELVSAEALSKEALTVQADAQPSVVADFTVPPK